MTGRERMMIALENGRADRLPCQVHGWMNYYLKHYLGGMDWYQANERFGLDYAIYVSPGYTYDEHDLANWQVERRDLDAWPGTRWDRWLHLSNPHSRTGQATCPTDPSPQSGFPARFIETWPRTPVGSCYVASSRPT